MAETYRERVARIQHDHNISENEAVRVARSEMMLEERRRVKEIQDGIASGLLIRTGPGTVAYKEQDAD